MSRLYKVTQAGAWGRIAPRTTPPIRKLPSNKVLDIRTGEITEMKVNAEKTRNSLNKTKNKMKSVLYSNLKNSSKWITLTTQQEFVLKDLKYYKRLVKMFVKSKVFSEICGTEYLGVNELQKRGALHTHIVAFKPPKHIKKTDKEVLRIEWEHIVNGHGTVDVRTKKPEDIGGYMCKQFSKFAKAVETKNKQLYFRSRNLKKPIESIEDYEGAKHCIARYKAKPVINKIGEKEYVVSYRWHHPLSETDYHYMLKTLKNYYKKTKGVAKSVKTMKSRNQTGLVEGLTQLESGIPKIVDKYGRNVISVSENVVQATLAFDCDMEEKHPLKSSQKILTAIREKPDISIPEIANSIGLSAETVKDQIQRLKDKGILHHVGPNKGGYWEITKS